MISPRPLANAAPPTRRRTPRRLLAVVASTVAATSMIGFGVSPASADSFVPISGAGSTWSENALNQWISAVAQYGQRVNFAGTGSSDGRSQFRNGTVDFAASDIPFQAHPTDGSQPESVPGGSYAYIPVTAGGTVFMYNLSIAGKRVTNLRLSSVNIAKIFTGAIKNWNDPILVADNPQLNLPARSIVPVVRSDGSGSTAQFTTWMIATQPSIWNAYCQTSGRAPSCGLTSNYPTISGMVAQSGDLGVAGYVSQSFADGAIGYVNYSYALQQHFPVAKMLNAAGYYTEPTPNNVAVSLLQAQVDTSNPNDPTTYLTQKLGNVYTDPDPRTYPLSSYSYMILPTVVQGQFSTAKGKTLSAFAYYAMCQGQQSSASLGYSPMPVNLVQDTFSQIAKIPGAAVQNITIRSCNNPTFSPDGTNLLATQAPQPPACDKQGPTQCATGTGGAVGTATILVPSKTAPGGTLGTGPGTSGAGAKGPGSSGTGTATGSSVAGAANGSASGTSGSAGAGTPAEQAAAAAAAANCDPSSGTCALSSGGGTALSASAVTIATKKGWSGTQSLMLLAGALVLAVVLAPGLVGRFGRRRS